MSDKEPKTSWKERFDNAIPHSSVRVWQRLFNKDAKKMLPVLRFFKEKAWVIIIAMILGGAFAGIFGSLTVLEATNKPVQLWDVCSSPAHLTLSATGTPTGCIESTIVTQTVNGAPQVKNETIPAGTLYLINGTHYSGGG